MRASMFALSVIGLCGSAHAACKPLVEIVELAAKDHVTIRPLPAEVLAPLTQLYNANPPASNEEFTASAVGESPDGSAVLIFLRGADVCGNIAVPAPMWGRLKPVIFGTGA